MERKEGGSGWRLGRRVACEHWSSSYKDSPGVQPYFSTTQRSPPTTTTTTTYNVDSSWSLPQKYSLSSPSSPSSPLLPSNLKRGTYSFHLFFCQTRAQSGYVVQAKLLNGGCLAFEADANPDFSGFFFLYLLTTWSVHRDVSSPPKQITNKTGKIILVKNGLLDLSESEAIQGTFMIFTYFCRTPSGGRL